MAIAGILNLLKKGENKSKLLSPVLQISIKSVGRVHDLHGKIN